MENVLLGKIVKPYCNSRFKPFKKQLKMLYNLYFDKKRNRFVTKKICGIRYNLDLKNNLERTIYSNIYEPQTTKLFLKILRKEMVVLDIGANVGYFTLLCAKNSPDGIIYSFEPMSLAYRRMQKNISLNKFGNIKTEKIALHDKNESKIQYFKHLWMANENKSLRDIMLKGETENVELCKDCHVLHQENDRRKRETIFRIYPSLVKKMLGVF